MKRAVAHVKNVPVAARALLKDVSWRARAAWVWFVVAAAYFLWEAIAYRGLYAVASEWQLDQFGRYLPVFTYACLVTILGLAPASLILRFGPTTERERRRRTHVKAVRSSRALATGLFAFAILLLLAACASLIRGLAVPDIGTPSRVIDIGSPESLSPEEGHVVLRGRILYPRTSAFAQNLLLARRGIRFAPMVGLSDQGNYIRYFVELPGRTDVRTSFSDMTQGRRGLLRKNALPGSIVRLYGYAGDTVEQPYFVLYTSSQTLRWPYYIMAVQFMLGALITGLAYLLHRRHMRDDRVDRPLSSSED